MRLVEATVWDPADLVARGGEYLEGLGTGDRRDVRGSMLGRRGTRESLGLRGRRVTVQRE